MGSGENSLRRVVLPLIALAVLVLGVGNAAGRPQTTSTIVVEVIGLGTISGSSNSIHCGSEGNECVRTFSNDAVITLSANPANGWSFGSWSGSGCSGTGTCVIHTNVAGDKIVTANFTPNSGAPQSTLSVTYNAHVTLSNDTGHVTAPERSGVGTEIDCGSAGPTANCNWTALTGSVLTIFQEPDTGAVFTGWSGPCTNTQDYCTVRLSSSKTVGAKWADPTTAPATHTLSVTVSGSGKVTGGGLVCNGPATCTAEQQPGATVTLTAEPADGFAFMGWTGQCAGSGAECTVTMDTDRSVTATFTSTAIQLAVTVSGNGNVSGGSGAINCGSGGNICSSNFTANASITLVATPATGATFTGWTGTCGGTATTCTVLMNQSKSVTATFTGGTPTAPAGFTLSVSVSGSGTVTGSGINCGNGATTCSSPGHASGTTVTLTATPANGATFAGWSGGGCTGTTPTCTVIFTASVTVTATFTGGTAPVQLTVSVSGPGKVIGGTINCGNGSATCSAQVAQGSTVTLTATPASGAKFAGWGGSCAGTATTCSLSMTSARSVSATFTAGGTAGTLTINVGGKGTVSTTAGACTAVGPSKTCIQHFKAGASVTLAARPSAGQSFLGWSGACSGAKTTCTVKLTTAQTVTANFSSNATGGGGTTAALSAIGSPLVRKTSTGWNVILRFRTTVSGVATVRGLRAGRTQVALSLRVAAGRATIGPFPVSLDGFYTFEIRLAGRLLRERACLGTCGPKHRGDPFTLTREAPVVTKTGDIWSVTLHAVANQISDARIRAFRGAKLLVNQHFLGQATRMSLGPFLLGPGNYTLRLTAVDPYGRVRTLTWIVSLGR